MPSFMRIEHEIEPLTGLRFIAAFVVFVFHIHLRWPLADGHFLGNLIGQGAVGMSIFFMLSGFLLAYRYAGGKTAYRDYAVNRFARVYPIYAVAALVTLPWFGNASVAKSVGIVLSNIFLLQAWIPSYFPYWNIGASWSISVEAFCYALLPFILARLVRCTDKQLLYITVAIYWAAVLPGIIATFEPGFLNKVIYLLPIFRLPEFVLGSCLFLLGLRGRAAVCPWWLPAALGLYVLYLGFVGNGMNLYVGHNWATLPLIGLTLLTCAQGRGAIARGLATPLSNWFGRISYCFYSFQPLVLLSLIDRHDAMVAAWPPLANNLLFGSMAFSMLLCVSALGYYSIEEPLRGYIRRHWGKGRHA